MLEVEDGGGADVHRTGGRARVEKKTEPSPVGEEKPGTLVAAGLDVNVMEPMSRAEKQKS